MKPQLVSLLAYEHRSFIKKITFEDNLLEHIAQGQFCEMWEGVLHFLYKFIVPHIYAQVIKVTYTQRLTYPINDERVIFEQRIIIINFSTESFVIK
jgi:hypothetical protein